jgi:hypothetical protein
LLLEPLVVKAIVKKQLLIETGPLLLEKEQW